MNNEPEISILIVSYNTKDLLRKCLNNVIENSQGLSYEIIIVDNASKDGSPEMVAAEFPQIRLIRSDINLGFGPANNVAYQASQGKYIILLNSDAFLHPRTLNLSLDKVKSDASIGLGGARLINSDGSWQPSARLFPSLLNEFLQLSGLAAKYPKSKFFGRFNMTWKSANEPCLVDWVPGAFAIIPRIVLEKLGFFDEIFFLYYEEVDLCFRIKQADYKIWYFPDVVVTHLGGESAKTQSSQFFSSTSSQLELWRMRSQLLYFRKNYGWWSACCISLFEQGWHCLRALKNFNNSNKKKESQLYRKLLKQAWKETQGGQISPPPPW
jgi:GT2 family glycosyltransferase